MKKKILLFLLLIPYTIFSQEYIYKEFGLNEGLPSMQAYDMHQDKNGIIWFATDRGIANYNGYEVKQFGIKEGLPFNVVLGFFPQPDGKVYCSTFDRSLFYFEEDFNGFVPYKYNDILSQSLNPNQIIQHLYLGKAGDLNVSCHYKIGKLLIDAHGIVRENKHDTSHKNLHAVCERYNNGIFYYLSGNVSHLNNNALSIPCNSQVIEFITLPNTKNTVFRNETEVSILDSNSNIITTIKNKFRPIVVKAISSSTFFIGYLFGGGKIVDIKGNVLQTFLNDESITNFLIDREGGYWFTTLYSGVFYIKDPKIRIFNQNDPKISIYSLSKNSKNELFAGYENGKIVKIDANNNSSIYFNPNDKYRSFFEHDILSGNFLLFSYSDNTFVTKKSRQVLPKTVVPYILKFSEPAENGILVAQMGGVRLVDIDGDTPDKVIKVPLRVHDACYLENDIYLATPQGVYVYTVSGKLVDLKQKNKLFSYRVDDIDYNENREELYLASLGKGLIVYNKKTGKVFTISKKDGLCSDIINEVHIESKNEIWVCTNSGLNRIIFSNEGKFIITGLKSSDGLLNDGISDVEIIKNTVWIASKKGLVYVPKQLFNVGRNNKGYPLRIKKVLVNEKGSSIKSLNDLSHNENRVELNFEGVSFKSEGNLFYKYKLEGLDKKWYYTKNRKVTFSSLPYGNYIFKIVVQDHSGNQRGNMLAIPIAISPPLWKTGWFIALLTIAILGIIYFFFKLRVLSYNKDITRELLRVLIKKIKSKDRYFVFKESGKDIRVKTDTILYVKSSGNYIELVTENKTYIVRCKIGDFITSTPDPLEYLRIHRSCIIRIDKVEAKSKTEVLIKGERLPVSDSYATELDKLIF